MKKLRIITTIIVILFFSLTIVYADGNDSRTEELIDKYESRIANAKMYDWKTYAECADALISMGVANDKVMGWIDRSIEVKETIYNRIVRGDCLLKQGKITDAKKEYIKAIGLAQQTGERDKISGIQWKILVAMGIENYNNFQSNGH